MAYDMNILTKHYQKQKYLSWLNAIATRWMMRTALWAGLLFVLLSCSRTAPMSARQDLDKGWVLEAGLHTPSLEVEVPGLIHTDLFKAGLIPDPFYADNEKDLQWIAEQNWTYSLYFVPDPVLFQYERLALVFDGLDTYAHILLNGKELLQTDNMFRQYEIDVSDKLLHGENHLQLHFFPADSINRLKAFELPYRLPDERAFSRKAPYQLGWDWGPTYATMGIWKSVRLIGWDQARILSPSVHTLDVKDDYARLGLLADVESTTRQQLELFVYHEDQQLVKQNIVIEKGRHPISVTFDLKQPRLWWPNGLGKQELYNFRIELREKNTRIDSTHILTGIRQIELVQEPDYTGSSFHFQVNGQAVFVKGTNYIPEDHFPVRYNRAKTRKLLTDAALVHMNMIRVWGGGIYPDESFFELCDSLGLMVWQDFMFACTMYPFDDSFLSNIQQEAIQQVKRLRKHPSLALWCGNNEISEGFHNWGWQQDLHWTAQEEKEIWGGYQQLFEKILPEIISQADPLRPYWPSSPSTGWGRPESLELGDVHYWGVWWGEEPFEMYLKKRGRFHSEYGFQAMPNIASLKKVIPANELRLSSTVMEAHQKHERGTQLIREYMQRDFLLPENLEEYVYMSQLVQAHGIGMAIKAHRRNKPMTMGTLYWQLNDSWPAISWSSIDYYGKWKALHYQLKHAYAPLLLSVETKGDSLYVIGVNDGQYRNDFRLKMELKDFNGKILDTYSSHVSIDTYQANLLYVFTKKALLTSNDPAQVFLHMRLLQSDSIMAEAIEYFVRPKDLKLKPVSPEIKVQKTDTNLELFIQSNGLVKNLFLYSNDQEGVFSDNYFDLIPGYQYCIQFHPSQTIPLEELRFDTKCLNSFAASALKIP